MRMVTQPVWPQVQNFQRRVKSNDEQIGSTDELSCTITTRIDPLYVGISHSIKMLPYLAGTMVMTQLITPQLQYFLDR